jgi:hypothetical protein
LIFKLKSLKLKIKAFELFIECHNCNSYLGVGLKIFDIDNGTD